MKVSVDDQELYTLSDTQKAVIRNEIQDDIFDADMKRRLQWILTHKYDVCFDNLKKEWDQKLAALGVAMIPTDPEAYAKLVLSQPTYMSRTQRDAAEKPLGA